LFLQDLDKRPPWPSQGERPSFPFMLLGQCWTPFASLIRHSICLDILARILVSWWYQFMLYSATTDFSRCSNGAPWHWSQWNASFFPCRPSHTWRLLGDATHLALLKVLNFAVSPLVLPIEDILDGVEKVVSMLLDEAAEEVWQEAVRILGMSIELRYNNSRAGKWAVHTLQGNDDFTILWADKGNAMLILNTVYYTEKVMVLLDDSAYKKLTKDHA